jgi:hypothetical protein
MKRYYILMVGRAPYQQLHAIHAILDSAIACMENMTKLPAYSMEYMELTSVSVNDIGTVVGSNIVRAYEPLRGINDVLVLDF